MQQIENQLGKTGRIEHDFVETDKKTKQTKAFGLKKKEQRTKTRTGILEEKSRGKWETETKGNQVIHKIKQDEALYEFTDTLEKHTKKSGAFRKSKKSDHYNKPGEKRDLNLKEHVHLTVKLTQNQDGSALETRSRIFPTNILNLPLSLPLKFLLMIRILTK
jgi:hypothetical protein